MQVQAWLTHIKTETIAYPACTLQYNGKQCNKKVQESGQGDGQWYCERCAGNCQAEWRYMLNLKLEDHTGMAWVTAFQVGCCCLNTPLRLMQLPGRVVLHAEAESGGPHWHGVGHSLPGGLLLLEHSPRTVALARQRGGAC